MQSEHVLGCRRLLLALIGVAICGFCGCSRTATAPVAKPTPAAKPTPVATPPPVATPAPVAAPATAAKPAPVGGADAKDATGTNRYEVTVDNKDAGKDPHRFRTARAMYDVAKTADPDATMADLVRQVGGHLETHPDPSSPNLRTLMLGLEPYRTCDAVQARIPAWAGRCAAWVKEHSSAAAPSTQRAETCYRRAQFSQAVDEYSRILRESPDFSDARNNLALAELHQKHDLAAQFQLEVLQRVKPTYLPATINLTVAYERLGRSVPSKAMALKASAQRHDVPAATFNLAWWQFTDGETEKAEQTLRPLVDWHIDPVYDDFHKAMQAKLGRSPGPGR